MWILGLDSATQNLAYLSQNLDSANLIHIKGQ